MYRPTGSWFWSSWFRTGYPFQRRFLERSIIFRTHESSHQVNSHLKLFKDRLLLKIRFHALTSKLLYSCCTPCFSVQSGRIWREPRARGSLNRVHNVPEGDGDRLKRKGRGRRRKIVNLRAWFCAWWEILRHNYPHCIHMHRKRAPDNYEEAFIWCASRTNKEISF